MSKSKRKIDLTGAQVMAGVLATLTAAIATSYVSRWGTLIAAAAVSVISTAGSAVYRYYLSRTGEKLRSAAPAVKQRANMYGAAFGRAPGHGASAAQGRDHQVADPGAPAGHRPAGTGDGRDAATEELPAISQHSSQQGSQHSGQQGGQQGSQQGGQQGSQHSHDRGGAPGSPQLQEPSNGPQRPHWMMLAGLAAGIFILAMAAITVVEIAAGRSMYSLVTGKSGSGTTIGVVHGGNGHPASPAPTSVHPTSTSPTPRTVPAPTPTVAPTPTPTPTPTTPATSAAPSPHASPPPASSAPSP